MIRKGQTNLHWILFIGLVVMVVGFAAYDFLSEKKAEQIKSEGSVILNWNPDQIESLEWVFGEQGMKLKRTKEGWFFESPIQEKADSEAVITFVEGLVLEKSNVTVKGGYQNSEPIDWKIFGLDQPKARIKVKNNLGAEAEFLVSAKKNFQGDTYFRKGNEQQVLLVSSTWQQKADKRVLDFRDRRWARLSPADIESASIRRGKEKFEIAKKDNIWGVTGRPAVKLDQNRVRKFLSDMTNNQVLGFEIKVDSEPMVELSLQLKDGHVWNGKWGVNKDKKHFLKVADLGLSMEVSAQNADELYRLSESSLRDHSEPFQVRRDDVKKILIWLDDKKWELALKADVWSVSPGSHQNYVNSDLLKAMLNKVSGLEVAEFLLDRADQGRKKSQGHQQRMQLISGDDKTILDLTLNGPEPRTMNGLEKAVFFAMSNQVPYHFTIEEAQWTGLGWKSILTAPTEKKSEEKKFEEVNQPEESGKQ